MANQRGTRQRGRPALDQRVREIIFLEATRDRDAPRKDVAKEIRRQLQDGQLKVPAFSTLMAEISEARRHAKSPLDEPWCVGLLPKYPLQPEALPALLEVWKVSLAEREPLTVREAQWVCRLHSVVRKPSQLREWAKCYATRELAADATKATSSTFAFDTALAMDLWEAGVAFLTGIAGLDVGPGWLPNVEHSPEERKVAFENAFDLLESETWHWIARAVDPDARQSGSTDTQEEAFNEMMRRYRKGIGGSVQAVWVLYYWLVYLRRGPKWKDLPPHRVKRLLEQMTARVTNIVRRDWEYTGNFCSGSVSAFDLNDLIEDRVLVPIDLLKAMGHETDRRRLIGRVVPVEGKGTMLVSEEEAAAIWKKHKMWEYEDEEEGK